jgi:hypothetical protein
LTGLDPAFFLTGIATSGGIKKALWLAELGEEGSIIVEVGISRGLSSVVQLEDCDE